MSTYTYSTARQNLSSILEEAKESERVFIQRKNGDLFQLIPIETKSSPLDIPGINTNITKKDIITAVRDSRSRL